MNILNKSTCILILYFFNTFSILSSAHTTSVCHAFTLDQELRHFESLLKEKETKEEMEKLNDREPNDSESYIDDNVIHYLENTAIEVTVAPLK